jgi:hypothetical protein
MNYYDEYTGEVDIFQLGSFDAENDRDRVHMLLDYMNVILNNRKLRLFI